MRQPIPVLLASTALAAATLLAGCGDRPGEPVKSEPLTSFSKNGGTSRHVPGRSVCPGATHLPARVMAAKELAAGVPPYVPDDALARATDAWFCGALTSGAYFIDQMQVSIETGWDGVDPPSKVADMADFWGGRATTVQGVHAWVAPGETPGANSEILLVLGGPRAIVITAAHDVPFERLTDLAEHLDLDATAGQLAP